MNVLPIFVRPHCLSCNQRIDILLCLGFHLELVVEWKLGLTFHFILFHRLCASIGAVGFACVAHVTIRQNVQTSETFANAVCTRDNITVLTIGYIKRQIQVCRPMLQCSNIISQYGVALSSNGQLQQYHTIVILEG